MSDDTLSSFHHYVNPWQKKNRKIARDEGCWMSLEWDGMLGSVA